MGVRLPLILFHLKEKGLFMKKSTKRNRFLIIAIVILVAILLVPIPHIPAGGPIRYVAIVYTVYDYRDVFSESRHSPSSPYGIRIQFFNRTVFDNTRPIGGLVDEYVLSTSHYSDITNRHFERFEGFDAAFIEKEEEAIHERIREWLNSDFSSEGYYRLVSADPSFFNMWIYYSPEEGFFGYYSFRFSVVDDSVNIYVIEDEDSPVFLSDYLLILVAPQRGTRGASFSKLTINGVNIEMQDATFIGT